ncbi:MAG: CopG family transcriptional regulator [Acidobacteria bacterium]|nr:MAG: CopG family transcriptional regulator [Acidobacteriota bacterium]RLE32289.1 MAG: CopG family transcriptional regulator [Acidobacteriota bacterium]
MIRTQVYLTEQERNGLLALAETSGKKQSELIREAVDRLLAQFEETRIRMLLENAAGMWKDRDDLPDFGATRRSLDRT